MDEADIRAGVYRIVAKSFDLDVENIKPTASIIDDLGGDSLDLVEITMRIEETFGIEIPDEDMERAHTVEDFVNIAKKAAS